MSWSTGRLVQIVAGALIGLVGTGSAFALNGASFVVSAAFISSLEIPAHAGQIGGSARRGLGSCVADARAGLAFARQDVFVSRLVVVQSLASFAVGATGAMLVVLSERHLGLPREGFAWLIGAIGAGALIGPLIPNTFARGRRDAPWLFVPYLIRGAGGVLIAVFTPFPVALLDVSWSAMRLLSLGLGALVVDRVGIQPLYWVGGTLLAVAGALGLLLLGRYRFPAEES